MKSILLLITSTVIGITVYGQTGKGINYENRVDILNAPDCNASEVYLKKKIKAQVANFYKDYPFIAVDFTSFKGQNGYTDKTNSKKIIYPYKIEMLVYLKRKVMKDQKEATELVTWKYDAVYNYSTEPVKKCELTIVPSSQITRINHKIY